MKKTTKVPWRFCIVGLLGMSLVGCGDNNKSNNNNNSTLSLTNFQAASVVIGQPDFTSNSDDTSAATLGGYLYGSGAVGDGVLYLPDYDNNRVLGYDMIPTTNGASADFVLGQTDFVSSDSDTTASTMAQPQSACVSNGKLFVIDYDNNRILIYNTLPTTTGASADVVVGQPDFTTSDYNITAVNVRYPESVFAVDNKLIVADTANNRVLIWNAIPTANGAAADIVLGQSTFATDYYNDDGMTGVNGSAISARTMYSPSGVWSDGARLVVIDTYNNRVLIWNSFPTANFTPADVVLGQSDFEHNESNDDNQDGSSDSTPSARTLYVPYYGVSSVNGQLFITDYYNQRVLVWNSFPTANFTPADVVLGQSDFEHNEYNDDDQDGATDSTPSARTLNYPAGVYVSGNKLIVTDSDNYRYLVYEGL